MDLRERFRQAFESLADHPRRVIASAMGVLWGAAAIVLMLAWGSGFREFMREEMSRYGKGCLFIIPAVTSSGFPGHRAGVHVRLSRDDAAAAEGANHDEVEAILPEHLSRERVRAEVAGHVRRLDLTGVDARFASLRNFSMAGGRFFDATDIELRRAVAVLGYDAAQALFGQAEHAVGRTLHVEGRPLEVIGVAARKGRQYMNNDRLDNQLLIIPITSAEALFGYDEKSVSILVVYPRPGVTPERAFRAVVATLGPRAGFHPDDIDAVRWYDLTLPSRISELFYAGFMVFMGIAGTVTLLIGAVGIANYQLATLAERAVEIAVARAIGARSRTLVVQTVIESLLVSGGTVLLGVLLGVAGCVALATLTPPGLFPKPIVSAITVGVTAVATLGVAIVAAVVPALRVRRMEIAMALRAGM
ncbi:MAG: ABC transporter permease [Candidatus Binatia bacterium]